MLLLGSILRLLLVQEFQISQQRRERGTQVVRHGSYQFLIGLSGLCLLLFPLQDRNPHPVDPLCQFPQFIASLNGNSVLHLAALQDLKLLF